MTIEEIIKEAFSQGWNAFHECATGFDYENSINYCLTSLAEEVKKLNKPVVSKSEDVKREPAVCQCEDDNIMADEFGNCPVCHLRWK